MRQKINRAEGRNRQQYNNLRELQNPTSTKEGNPDRTKRNIGLK